MSWKRPLYLFHRWAGIVLCLFFALWFISGIFIMYVGYPQLTKPERVAGAADLDFSRATLTPAEAVARLEPADFDVIGTPNDMENAQPLHEWSADSIRSMRVSMVMDRPAYVVHATNGAQPRVVFADSGEVLVSVTPSDGRTAVERFAARQGWDASRLAFEGMFQTDQWSLSGALNDHRPLLRYSLNDEAGTTLYVSSRTGEVVRDTRQTERLLNWFGAVTHWIYFNAIRQYPLVWEWVVDLLSVAGTLLAISGIWIGVLRWKRHPKPGKPSVPYRGIMRWHYWTGTVFGVVTITWVFSGLMSMNPLNLNPSQRPSPEQMQVYSGKPFTPSDFDLPAAGFGAGAIEADLLHYDGQPLYRVLRRDLSTQLMAASRTPVRMPMSKDMMHRAALLLPQANVVDMQILTSYDNYYYTRHPERGGKSLPIIRVKFDDPQATWFHLDPRAGQVIERSTFTNRVYRWIYNGLHSWDILWLWERRPLWDICVIAFSLGGTLLSLLGVVIGVKRLQFKYGTSPKSARQERRVRGDVAMESSI